MAVLTDDNLDKILPDPDPIDDSVNTSQRIDWWRTPEFSEVTQANSISELEWHQLFMDIATRVSYMSKCASRHIGAVIVRNKQLLAIGYNGAPAKSNLCQTQAYCPRAKLGFKSGQAIELCPAQHAERNAISNAAKNGISTAGASLYCNCGLPCKDCAGALINAGIKEVVCMQNEPAYDSMAAHLFTDANITIRYI